MSPLRAAVYATLTLIGIPLAIAGLVAFVTRVPHIVYQATVVLLTAAILWVVAYHWYLGS